MQILNDLQQDVGFLLVQDGVVMVSEMRSQIRTDVSNPSYFLYSEPWIKPIPWRVTARDWPRQIKSSELFSAGRCSFNPNPLSKSYAVEPECSNKTSGLALYVLHLANLKLLCVGGGAGDNLWRQPLTLLKVNLPNSLGSFTDRRWPLCGGIYDLVGVMRNCHKSVLEML